MDVRAATEADRETLLALRDAWVAAEPPPEWVPADARDAAAAGLDESVRRGAAFVAERDGRVVGFAAAVPRGAEALELTELYVRPEARGSGAARALVREVARAARAGGARHVFVATAPDGFARRLYEAWGFRAHSLELVVALEELETGLDVRPGGESQGPAGA